MHDNLIVDSGSCFRIDPIAREITRDNSKEPLTLVQGDHNSERVSFSVPRFVDGHDMSICDKVEIHYVNIDAVSKTESDGKYTVSDLHANEESNTAEFSWLIANPATLYHGTLCFLIRFICYEENSDVVAYAWNTGKYKGGIIKEGCDCPDELPENYVDIFESWKLTLLDKLSEEYITREKYNSMAHVRKMQISSYNELDNIYTPGIYEIDHRTSDVDNGPDTLYLICTKDAPALPLSDIHGLCQFKVCKGSVEVRSFDIIESEDIFEEKWSDWTSIYPGSGSNSDCIAIWKPNTAYNVGDVVLLLNPALGPSLIGICKSAYTSPDDMYSDFAAFGQHWDYGYINADKAASAKYDDEGNLIITTYATKKEIGDIETSLDNIVTKYGLGADTIAAVNEIIDEQNEILGVTE